MNSPYTLPPPLASTWEWQLHAACRGMDVEVFFQADSARGPIKDDFEAQAKVVCATCPVQRSCLDWALVVNERYGVWGGTTPEQRKQLSQRHVA